MSAPSSRWAGLVVFGLALALRVAYVLEFEQVLELDYSKLPQTDNHVFAAWARTIAEGDLLCREHPHAYHIWTEDVAPEDRWLEWYGGPDVYHQAPLYPYLVAAVYRWIGTDHGTVGLVQAVLGALTCWLTFLLASRTVGPRAGLLAGLLLAFCGAFYFYDAFILRDGLMALLAVLAALLLERAARTGRLGAWLLGGAGLGLFTLGKETGPALLLLALLGVAWLEARRPRRALAVAAALVGGWLLVLSPIVARNVALGVAPFEMSTRGPEVFVAGNARGQDGVGWDPPIATMRRILMDSNFELVPAMMLTVATHRGDPVGYLRLLWRKTSAFFNAYEVPNNVNFYLARAHLRTLRGGFVSLAFVAPAALLGLLLGIPRRRRLAVPYLMFGALAASVVLLYILGRFRLQVLPFFALFAALTVDWALDAWRGRRIVALALAAVPFALFASWTSSHTEHYEDVSKHTGVMMQHVKAGNFEHAMRYREHMLAALEETDPGQFADGTLQVKLDAVFAGFDAFERAMAEPEGSAARHLQLGHGYAALLPITKRGERVEMTDLALHHFEHARTLDPQVVGAWHGTGTVYGRLERLGEALRAFRAEMERNPRFGPAWRDAGMVHFTWQQHAEAARHLREALRRDTEDAEMLAALASIEIDYTIEVGPVEVGGELEPVHDQQAALEHVERALTLDPRHPHVREVAATVFYAHERFDEAIELLDELAVEIPWRADYFHGRARAFRQARDARAAVPLVEDGEAPGEEQEEADPAPLPAGLPAPPPDAADEAPPP